jgi:hypothetical protein
MATSDSGEAAQVEIVEAASCVAFAAIFYLASASASLVALLDGPDGSLSS